MTVVHLLATVEKWLTCNVAYWQSVRNKSSGKSPCKSYTVIFIVTCPKLCLSWCNIITWERELILQILKCLELLLGHYSNNGLLMWIKNNNNHNLAFDDFTNEPGKTQKILNIILARWKCTLWANEAVWFGLSFSHPSITIPPGF